MKNKYNLIIYILSGFIIIIGIILLIPNNKKEEKEKIDYKLDTKELIMEQSIGKKIKIDTNGNVFYRSLDTLIAIVTKEGIVIGINEGETKIEVSINNEIKDYVKVKVKKKAGSIDVDKSMITIIGDSRMVGLCSYKWYQKDKGTCIAKVSMGYKWLVDTALLELNKINSNKKKNIVINLGVNDLSNINKYLDKYQELTKNSNHIFLLSINPTKGKYDNLNERIDNFNKKLNDFAKTNNNITYCDSSTYLKNNGFSSSDGLHYNEATSKIIYSQIIKCIYDYYNK